MQIFRMFDREVFNTDVKSDTESNVVRTISYSSALGATSIDDCPDTPYNSHKKILNLPDISSSTIHNRIAETTLDDARENAYRLAKVLQEKGMLSIKLRHPEVSLTVLHLDGSKIFTHYGVSGTFGGQINYSLDFVPCERGGQEISASLEICKRANEKGIKLDIVTNDAIAYSHNYCKQLYNLGTHYFIRIRGDDERNLTSIEEFEHAVKLREVLRMHIPRKEIIYDDIKFTITYIDDVDPILKHPVRMVRIDSEPVGKKLERIREKDKKRKKKKKDTQYGWEDEPTWEILSERKMTHYIKTSCVFLSFENILAIYIDHWTIETHWRKIKRAFWSRNSYKKDVENAAILYISVSIGIAITEMVRREMLMEFDPHLLEKKITVLYNRSYQEKRLSLKRVRKYISRAISEDSHIVKR